MKWFLVSLLVFLWMVVCAAPAPQTVAYEYDGLHRLARVTYSNGWSLVYAYDGAGNRISRMVILDE